MTMMPSPFFPFLVLPVPRFFAALIVVGFSLIAGAVPLAAEESEKEPDRARFIILPDTQSYVEDVKEIDEPAPYYDRFTSQTDWILEHKEEVDAVLHVGDIVNRNIPEQWELARDTLRRLDGEVPYVLAVGNHDMGYMGMAGDRNTTYFNEVFPQEEMEKLPGFGGVFEKGRMDNAFYRFAIGPHQWLVLSLEFGPRAEVLEWAKEVAGRHPDHTVIVNTHSYMYFDDTRQGGKDMFSPHTYEFAKREDASVHDGEEMWEVLIRSTPNIRFVFSGHVLGDGCGTLVSENDAGHPVYQFLANFQAFVTGSEHGGDGYFRDMTLDFGKRRLIMRTRSHYPGIGEHPDEDHNFVIEPFEIVGMEPEE